MRYYHNRNKVFPSAIFCLLIGAALMLFIPAAYAQGTDYFGNIIVDSEGDEEIVLEIETSKPEPEDQMTIEPLRLKIISQYPVTREPNAKLVHIGSMRSGASVERGTVLQLDMGYDRPGSSVPRRKILLWSTLQNPHYALPSDTLYALDIYPDEGDELVWKKSSHATWRTSSDITKKASFTQQTIAGDKRRHSGILQFSTAVLKPGKYHFFLKLYRFDNGETVETDIERFYFTVVDTPLHLVADIPSTISTYDEDKSAVNIRYTVNLSDWAVPPIKARMRSDISGITLDHGYMTIDELDNQIFDILLMPGNKHAGRTANFTLTVTDGVGRTASLKRSVKITDGSSGEINVNMARSVNAGQTITGIITYPRGYKLLKAPFISDHRGFKWTSNDYTSFRIKVKEEGVHYKRLFAIVTKGRMNGLDYDPVLTWKRTYNIESQNLIYDAERNRRRTEANNKAWNDAFSAFASGVSVAASAYVDASADAGSNKSIFDELDTEDHDDKGFDQPLYGGSVGSPNFDGLNIDQGKIKLLSTITPRQPTKPSGTNSGSRQGSQSQNYQSSGTSSSEISEASVCGIAIAGWYGHSKGIRDQDGWWRYEEDDEYTIIYADGTSSESPAITLEKTGIPDDQGEKQIHLLTYFKDNCVLAYEMNPTSRGIYDRYEFYHNGGRKKQYSNNAFIGKEVVKSWDRKGNLIFHSVNKNTVCENFENPYKLKPKCS